MDHDAPPSSHTALDATGFNLKKEIQPHFYNQYDFPLSVRCRVKRQQSKTSQLVRLL